jgi:hypothetical protein
VITDEAAAPDAAIAPEENVIQIRLPDIADIEIQRPGSRGEVIESEAVETAPAEAIPAEEAVDGAAGQ